MIGTKRSHELNPANVQEGNRAWWSKNPMAYDWQGEIALEPFTMAWFDAIDASFLQGARLFATDQRPFDRIMPLERLAGAEVLEIGCGMGLHTETMIRAGARVTAVDISPTSIEATRRRLALKGLTAEVLESDAEQLPFPDKRFDFVWSWGVIHHSSRTAKIVREVARVLQPGGECRIMVYSRDTPRVAVAYVREHILSGAFLRRSFDETLYTVTDGFSARYYVREQFEDLFRAFFADVSSQVCGQDSDAIPLPRRLRALALKAVPESYLKEAQARRGAFILLTASKPF